VFHGELDAYGTHPADGQVPPVVVEVTGLVSVEVRRPLDGELV
jgi:hypothetical protein